MAEKRKVNIDPNKGKIGRPPPDWLNNLADGIYTVAELTAVSNTTQANVKILMRRYAVKITYIVQPNGRASARYQWKKKHFFKIIDDKNESASIEKK